MHRAIAAWLTERPWRAALASAVCGALSPLLPFVVLVGAIPVLALLRFDPSVAFGIALAAAAAWVILTVDPTPWVLIGIASLCFGPVVLATVLKRTGSMNLCFQIAVLTAALAVTIVHLLLRDPVAVWIPLLNEALESTKDAGIPFDGDQTGFVELWARTMWGVFATLSLATVLSALFLGCWWDSLLRAPGVFGEAYRRLRLGLVLGSIATVLFVASLASDAPLIRSLVWVGFGALAFQGLAAAHRSKAQGSLNRGWLAAIYVLLIVPLSTWITVFVLAAWGFADNWSRPRTQGA